MTKTKTARDKFDEAFGMMMRYQLFARNRVRTVFTILRDERRNLARQ